MVLQNETNNGALIFVRSNVELDVQDQSQYFDYDLTKPLNAHNINICCDLNSIIGARAKVPLKLPYMNNVVVSGEETQVYIDNWDNRLTPTGNNTDANARNELRAQLFDHTQPENSAANSGAAVLIKLRTPSTSISGMEGFIKNKGQLDTHRTHIQAYDDLVSGGISSGSGVDWTTIPNKTIFDNVHYNNADGLITRPHLPTDKDTRSQYAAEGESIATMELMNDYLTSSKTVDTTSGNVYEEFNIAKRLDSQDTVLGQLEEAVISFFEAVNFTPEIANRAAVTNQSEQLFLRSWMDREVSNTAVKKFSIEAEKIRNLLFSGTQSDRHKYQTDPTTNILPDGTSVAEDLIRCVFDQDQVKTLAQQIQQSGRYTPLTGHGKVYISEANDGTGELSVGTGAAITQADYTANCQSITPNFRHGQGVAVIVKVKATVPGKAIQTGYFLVRVFQSRMSQDGTITAAHLGGIGSNAPNALP